MIRQDSKFILKKPDYRRRSFSISVFHESTGWKVYDSKDIKAINEAYSSNELSFAESTEACKAIMRHLYKERESLRPKVNGTNRAIFENYFLKAYGSTKVKRMMEKSVEAAYNDINRALKAVSEVDLANDSIELIQNSVDEYFEGYEQHASACGRLNSLLDFIDRPKGERLHRLDARFRDSEVKYIEHEEFLAISECIEDRLDRVICNIAYFGGFRQGELFWFPDKKIHIKKHSNYIKFQMYRNGEKGLTKNRKDRHAFYFPEGREFLNGWITVDQDTRIQYRNKKWWEIVRKACRKAGVAEINFHDLRHCYAIRLLEHGITLDVVADMIGDTIEACRKHYTGFARTDRNMALIASQVSKNSM